MIFIMQKLVRILYYVSEYLREKAIQFLCCNSFRKMKYRQLLFKHQIHRYWYDCKKILQQIVTGFTKN